MASSVSQGSPFHHCISAVFDGWTALQLAVAHSFGGEHSREKAMWMISATEDWFRQNSDIFPYELEEFLGEIMTNEFETVVEDNSSMEVSVKICEAYSLCQQNNTESIEKFISEMTKKTGTSSVASSQHQASTISDGDSDENMDTSSQNIVNHINALQLPSDDNSPTSGGSQEKTEEEGDGWTTVNKTNRRKR